MSKKTITKYILYVGSIQGWRDSLEEYTISNELPWKFISFVSQKKMNKDLPETNLFKQIVIDFEKPEEIIETIKGLGKNLIAAINRGERNIPNFQKIIPHLPKNILVPSIDSLIKATEKPEIGRYPKIQTPFLRTLIIYESFFLSKLQR